MLKLETNTTNGGAAARNTCQTYRSDESSVYCRADMFDRDWMCESCERAPAAFLCKADSASLCAACDAEIHSANPLARRHHRVPISGSLYGSLAADQGDDQDGGEDEDVDEAASWLLLNPLKNGDDVEARPALFAGGEVDEYLDLDDYNQFNEEYNNQQQHAPQRSSYGGDDCIVPIQYQKGKNHCFQLGDTYPESLSHSSAYTMDLLSIGVSILLTPMDREARVLRYREKKKSRKFEKTIRYASRKAYAETRPRIKGRFAKRIRDAEVQEIAYGVVPSF